MPSANLNLSPNLQRLQTGIVKLFTAKQPNMDTSKIQPMYSKGVLTNENLLNNGALVALSGQVSTQLNNAKALMNKLGINDVTKAPAITVNTASLRVIPGQLKPNPGFTPNSVLPEKSSVIIASTLDLTNTNLVVDPSVNSLTIIVETLTCGAGAQLSFDDSTVWKPLPSPQTTAQPGTNYNSASPYTDPATGKTSINGPSGGPGSAGATGSAQNTIPPATPSINIYALNITGMPAINLPGLKGAPGNPGQNGGNGGNGAAGINGSDVAVLGVGVCNQSPGDGGNGGSGGSGGKGGNGGQGGAGGSFFIATTLTNWEALIGQSLTWSLANTGGSGGDPGLPGNGGAPGQGGRGGNSSPGGACSNSSGKKGANGNNGQQGSPGAPGNPGTDGPAGNGGTVTQVAITQAEWDEELTLPWLVSINPTKGPPGTAITAAVMNIEAGDTVLVNGQSVASTSPASGQMQFTLPATLSGSTATITIRRASDGVVSNSMTYYVQPFISGCSPTAGSVPMFTKPGTQVTISGGPFVAGSKVAFGNDTPIAPASIASGGASLTAIVPPTASSGPIAVTPAPGTPGFGQPEFAVDNYRNTRGFSWVNSGGSNSFQSILAPYVYADATALFGTSQTYKMLGPINLNGPWVNLFLTIANLLLPSGPNSDGGECFGMSLTSLQFAAGQIPFGNYPQQPAGSEPNGPPSPNVWMLNGLALGNGSNVSPLLTNLVHQRHMAQLSQESINQWISFHLNVSTAAGLRNAIQQAFTAGGATGAGAIIALNPTISDGHAVVACNIVDTGNGSFNILLYNPNVPFTPSEDSNPAQRAKSAGQCVIQVDSNGNWTLLNSAEMFGQPGIPDWTGGIFNITVIPWNTVPLTPTFPWAEVVAAAATGALAFTAVIWIVAGDAAVSQVSDGQGHTLFANGQWNVNPATMLPGVRPMPNLSGSGKSMAPAFVSNKSGALIHTITGAAAGTYDLNWLGVASGATLSAVPTTPGANDTVVLDSGEVSFTPDHDKAASVVVIGTSTNTKLARTGKLKTMASAGKAIELSYDAAADTFSYVHAGSAATYTLELSSVDAQGNPATFVMSPTPVATGDTHTFAPDWTQLAAGVGTLQVRTAAGATTSTPLKPV